MKNSDVVFAGLVLRSIMATLLILQCILSIPVVKGRGELQVTDRLDRVSDIEAMNDRMMKSHHGRKKG